MRRRIVIAVALASGATAIAAAACGAFSGTDTSDTETDASTVSDTSDANAKEITDATVILDAPAINFDAAGDGGFCAQNTGHTLCDDFDESVVVDPGWAQDNNDGGTIAIDPLTATSKPNSLSAFCAQGSRKSRVSRVVGNATSSGKVISASASIKLAGSTDDIDVVGIDFTLTDTTEYSDCSFDIAIKSGGGPVLEETCFATKVTPLDAGNFTASHAFPNATETLDAFTRITLSVDTVQGVVSGTVGNAVNTVALDLPAGVSPQEFTLTLGVNNSHSGNPNVHVDDVIVDVQ